MKNFFVLMAVLSCLVLSAYAQDNKPSDFSGDWILDQTRSNMPLSGQNMKFMLLNVTQTETELSTGYVGMKTEREANSPLPKPHVYTSYDLTGKEKTTESPMPEAAGPSKSTAKLDKNKLVLITERKVKSPMGWVNSRTKEIWQLSSDNKTLKISREFGSGGQPISELLVFRRAETPAKTAGN